MRRVLTILLLVLCAAAPVRAATIEERVAAELQAQGYEILETNRTWLGRSRIVAENDEIRREIVFNPGTGEILRDYSVLLTDLELRARRQARSDSLPHDSRPPALASTAAAADTAGADSGQLPASVEAGQGIAADGDAAATVAMPDAGAGPEADMPLLPQPLIPGGAN